MSDIEMDNPASGKSRCRFLALSSMITFHFLETHNLAFDPDQNPEEKRAVRKDYRTLFKDVGGSSVSTRISIS
jgi:hypothetical protein